MKRLWAALLLGLATTASAGVTRQQLLAKIKATRSVIPSAAQDAVNVKYRGVFAALETEAARTQQVQAVDRRYAVEEKAYRDVLWGAHSSEFRDRAAFEAYYNDRRAVAYTLALLEEKKSIELTPQQLQAVRNFRGVLNNPSVSTAKLSFIARLVGEQRIASAAGALPSQYRPVQHAPERGLSEPPLVVAASYAPRPSNSALTSLIAGVGAVSSWVKTDLRQLGVTIEQYAQRVGNAIVDSSAYRNIDARLTTAIAWAESTFSAHVGSYAGCVGIGQLSQGTAARYGVSADSRRNIEANVQGTTGFLRDLQNKFTTHNDRLYLNGLFAAGADKVRRGAGLQRTFDSLWPQIPVGVKDQIAAYNAGEFAFSPSQHWTALAGKLPAPSPAMRRAPSRYVFLALNGLADRSGRPMVDRCYDRPDQDSSYCQTMGYTPKVLELYFTTYVRATPSATAQTPTVMASAERLSPNQG